MSFNLELTRKFRGRQGLASPIRNSKGLPPLQTTDGYRCKLRVNIVSTDDQLNDRGWFVDTDSLDDMLDEITDWLASKTWTELFSFRPTFELVARWAFEELRPKIPQLARLTLENETLGITLQYRKEQRL